MDHMDRDDRHGKKNASSAKNHRPMTDEQRQKNARSGQRNLVRKREAADAARVRLEYWSTLTPQQQMADLDRRLGKGKGATRQRARIQARIDAGDTQPKLMHQKGSTVENLLDEADRVAKAQRAERQARKELNDQKQWG